MYIILFIKKHKLLLLLLAISSFVYFRWLSFDYFVYCDNHFFYIDRLKDHILPQTWLSDHTPGHFNIQMWKCFYHFPASALAHFNIGYNISEKIILMWPIIFVLPLSSYLLIKKIVNNKIAAFVGGIVFTFNTYFLAINSQGHLSLTVACIFSNLAFYFFINSLENQRPRTIIVTSFFLFITGSYDLRFLYILWWLFLFYSFYYFYKYKFNLKNASKIIKSFVTPFMIFIFLSSYWILPQFLANELTNNEILSRNLAFVNYWGISEAMSLFHPFWSGTSIWQIPQQIPSHFFLIPLFAFLGFFVYRKRKIVIFFAFISVLGILLSKQNGVPFENLYEWMFENFPGFSAFREATKFYYLIILGYSVLIGFFVKWLWSKRKTTKIKVCLKFGLTILIVLIFIANTVNIFSGQIESLYTPKKIPKEYLIAKNYFNDENRNYRFLLVPRDSRWWYNSNKVPKFNLTRIIEDKWKNIKGYKKNTMHRYVDILEQDFSENLLNNYSVKYLVIPLDIKEDSKNDFSLHFKKDRDFYINIIEKLSYLKKVDIKAGNLLIYENIGYKPRLYITEKQESIYKEISYKKIEYKQFSTTKFKIQLKSIKEPIHLNFSDTYHPEWKIRLGRDINWFDSIFAKNYFYNSYFHYENDGFLNSFIINPEYIKQNFSKEYYKENPDGSIDVELVMYFKPQSYLYLGLIISGTTLLGCFGCLIYDWRKRKLIETKKFIETNGN